MVILRNFQQEDVEPLSEIHRKQPDLGIPSLSHVFVNKTIESDGKVLGYGVIKQFAEAVLILDGDVLKRDKVEALRQVMRIAIKASEEANLEQLYLTTSHPGWAYALQNSYGFVKCPDPFYLLNLR